MTANRINSMIFMLLITTFTVLFCCCTATVYKVGDSDGWSAKDYVYYEWAEPKNFYVGDSLVFDYDPNVNDVTQVSGALEYQFCEPSSPKAVYNTGHDVVTITEPGPYYFITSNLTQCVLGQRLDILVTHDLSRPIPSPPPTDNDVIPFGKIFKVGDSKGWKLPEDTDFYYKWSQEKHFDVGDNLLFEYDEEDNDVLEISGDLEFISCDQTSPVSVHKTGHDLVKLTKPGVHYFITSKTVDCSVGLKLRVVVGEPVPDVPKLSPMDSFARWLRQFRPYHH